MTSCPGCAGGAEALAGATRSTTAPQGSLSRNLAQSRAISRTLGHSRVVCVRLERPVLRAGDGQ
eukprot:CAMPEP_0185302214 /NCGR_PEP_ID=MMETSP1363-20130426/13284_1 /TAXON_ID=38817 /ORGANISM="Gephyrocapsa oceanica, Strain RCC1303" /LENGTH=63 /DNA_ID=CAMNT_0027899285 /DNA_START=53 /DNA_END=241 /DNA_ORIENTATION=+